MNELYNQTIEFNGNTYYYDPDMDCFYRRYAPMSTWDRISPLVVLSILSILCWTLS